MCVIRNLNSSVNFMSTMFDCVITNPVPNPNLISVHKRSIICASYARKKTFILNKTLLLLFILFCPQNALSQDVVYIDYVEAFNDCDSVGISLPIKNKTERAKSSSSLSFVIEHDENVADSVVKCLEVATDIWRSCIKSNTNYKIRLKLTWEDLPEDEDIRIKVAYVPDSLYEIYTPASLYYSMKGCKNDGSPDAKITINKNKLWDCGYSIGNGIGVRNLSYAMLRSVAIALGFGSSLSLTEFSSKKSIVKFPFSKGHSLFDNALVSGNGMHLNSLRNTGSKQNADIVNFCTGVYGDVYFDRNIPNSNRTLYKMYTPRTYEKNKSLIFLDNENALMHYSLNKKAKVLQVDTVTEDILNRIGWEFSADNPQIQITSDEIPETGITSAYTSHTFYIKGIDINNIEKASWAFSLVSSEGDETIVKRANNGGTFEIDAITNPNSYSVNVNGDLYGKITFSGIYNGYTINLQYNVTLELKPSISNVSFVKECNEGYDTYNVLCKVDYKGADFLFVTLEEEYGSTLRSQYVREPYLAHFSCKDITSPYYAWIDITVENKYGKDTYTIELPPYNNNCINRTKKDITRESQIENISTINVLDANGNYLKSLHSFSETQLLKSGIYIIEYVRNNKIVATAKLIK